MKYLTFCFCLWAINLVSFAQEATKQPQTLVTEKQTIIASVKLPTTEAIKLHGEAIYYVEMVNSDDTLMGKFVFALSDEARQQLALKTKREITEIPRTLESEKIVAEFAKKTGCPEIHLEIKPLSFKLMDNFSASFERLELILKETSQEVSKVMCSYVKRIFIGRGYTGGLLRRINRLLKGEAAEN